VARGEISEDIGQRYQLTRKVEIAKIDTGMIPRSRQESDSTLLRKSSISARKFPTEASTEFDAVSTAESFVCCQLACAAGEYFVQRRRALGLLD
jgi:hypothetical protein